ncbi:MAG TPA: hypothetical protein LFW13_05325 [Rickettsia endosymbiont of Sericostoma sp.]|nr:hypothetical protein [Rickettsia endosymbiont of Sericostoma sp.]
MRDNVTNFSLFIKLLLIKLSADYNCCILYSNDLENWNVKQGVSERSVHEVREYANTPKFYGANSSKQKSIHKYNNLT